MPKGVVTDLTAVSTSDCKKLTPGKLGTPKLLALIRNEHKRMQKAGKTCDKDTAIPRTVKFLSQPMAASTSNNARVCLNTAAGLICTGYVAGAK